MDAEVIDMGIDDERKQEINRLSDEAYSLLHLQKRDAPQKVVAAIKKYADNMPVGSDEEQKNIMSMLYVLLCNMIIKKYKWQWRYLDIEGSIKDICLVSPDKSYIYTTEDVLDDIANEKDNNVLLKFFNMLGDISQIKPPQNYQKISTKTITTMINSSSILANNNKTKASIANNNPVTSNSGKTKNDISWGWIILSILVALPIVRRLHNTLPNPDWILNLDRIVLAIIVFIIVFIVIQILVALFTVVVLTLFSFFDVKDDTKWSWTIYILSFLVALPVAMYLRNILPNPDWALNLDRIILYFIVFSTMPLIMHLFKWLVFVVLIGLICFLSYGSFYDKYGFKDIWQDYRNMLYALKNKPNKSVIDNIIKARDDSILAAIDNGSSVRNFATSTTQKHFADYQKENSRMLKYIQYFAIFKEINDRWNYVSDPAEEEYFAKASETISQANFTGDCDDYSILMAASIKSIGGTVRLIRIPGHIYPEVLIDSQSDLEAINYMIREKLFWEEEVGDIHYHTGSDGNIWLNLDYTEKYPGGHFMDGNISEVLYP